VRIMQKRTRVKKRSGRSTAKAMTVPRWTPGLPGDSTETGDTAEDEGPVVGMLVDGGIEDGDDGGPVPASAVTLDDELKPPPCEAALDDALKTPLIVGMLATGVDGSSVDGDDVSCGGRGGTITVAVGDDAAAAAVVIVVLRTMVGVPGGFVTATLEATTVNCFPADS